MATKKKATRRAQGAKRTDVPMYLDSDVHRMGEDDKLDIVRGGVMVDDTDLTDEEIEELTARRVIRPAKPDEIERAANAEHTEKRAQLQRDQSAEVAQLQAQQAQEKAKLEGGGNASPAALQKLADQHLKQTQDLQAKHTKALAAHDEKASS